MIQKISENQKKVLEVLAPYYDNLDGNCLFFRFIAKETKLSIREVRLACRALARKGLAEWTKGLFDEDGRVAGSGYCATRAGALLISPCRICKTNISDMVDNICHQCWEKRPIENFGK